MKKWTEVARLVAAVLMGVAAGLDVAKKMRELAEQEYAERPTTLPDLGDALAAATERVRATMRGAAERFSAHNDMPGED